MQQNQKVHQHSARINNEDNEDMAAVTDTTAAGHHDDSRNAFVAVVRQSLESW